MTLARRAIRNATASKLKMKNKNAQSLGSLGGKKTKEKYGENHFSKLAQKRWKGKKKGDKKLCISGVDNSERSL